MFGQYLSGPEVAIEASSLGCNRRASGSGMDTDIGREQTKKSLNHNRVALAKELEKRTLVADKNVGQQIGDDKLDLWGGGGRMDDASLHNKTSKTEAGLGGIGGELRHGIRRGDVEKKLVLEIRKHDYDESSDATEGNSVGPEASIL